MSSPLQEVTGGVTNYVARLPEPANTVEEWKTGIDGQLAGKDVKPKLSH